LEQVFQGIIILNNNQTQQPEENTQKHAKNKKPEG